MAGGWLRCRACRKQTSLTAGTIFEGTRKPLRMWFLAMWFVTSQKNGVSALGLQRELGLGSYETAWTWLHKLRRAMVRPGRDLLSGTIEVDETYVGGPEQGTRGRETESKAIVAIAVEKNGRGLGRIRLQQIGDVSTDSLLPFVQGAVERGAMVHTNGWRGYAGLAAAGYQHQVTVLSGGSDPAHEVMPRVHLVASLLKRWLIGTHQGGVQHQHLDYYLDEFTFRFNRRRSKARGLLFHRLAQQALAVGPAPYNAIVKPPGSSGSPATGNEGDTQLSGKKFVQNREITGGKRAVTGKPASPSGAPRRGGQNPASGRVAAPPAERSDVACEKSPLRKRLPPPLGAEHRALAPVCASKSPKKGGRPMFSAKKARRVCRRPVLCPDRPALAASDANNGVNPSGPEQVVDASANAIHTRGANRNSTDLMKKAKGVFINASSRPAYSISLPGTISAVS